MAVYDIHNTSSVILDATTRASFEA